MADSPPRLSVGVCQDLAGYARMAAALIRGDSDVIPVLGGGRDPVQLAALFPGAAFEWVKRAPGDAVPIDELASRLLMLDADSGDSASVVVAETGAPESLLAILYALATRRAITLVDALAEADALLDDVRLAILVGSADRFGKARLKALLERQHAAATAPKLGIVTGRDLAQCADVVAKSLLARMVRRHGHPVHDAAYELIGAHGNEIHLGYRDGVLCGRAPGVAAPGIRADAFDCARACPHASRYPADQVRAHTVLMVSCDSFTPSGGIAPTGSSLLFRLLDGPACTVLAPYKHVQANEEILVMVEAMARSGFALGDIASTVNAQARHGTLADPGYLVLGDPGLAVGGADPRPALPVERIATSYGTVINTRCAPGQSALRVTLEDAPDDGPRALLPLSEGLRTDDILFATATRGRDVTITVFREAALPDGDIAFAFVAAQPPPAADVAAADHLLTQCRVFDTIFADDPAVDDARAAVRALLRIAVAYPRPIENVLTHGRMLHFGIVVREHLTALQRALCDALLAAMSTRRIWISQEYGDLFARLARTGPPHDGDCAHCGGDVTTWRYDDPVTALDPRHLLICSRCGIVADVPVAANLSIDFGTVGALRSTEVPVTVRITNRGALPIRLSLAIQMNAWREVGVDGEHCRHDLELAPAETATHCATLRVPAGFPDDILSITLFVVTERMELLFLSQKVTAEVRTSPGQAAAPAAALAAHPPTPNRHRSVAQP